MDQLLAEVRAAFLAVPAAAGFLQHWPAGPERRAIEPGDLPVCRWLRSLASAPESLPVMASLAAAAPSLSWRQTYGAGDLGEAFLQGYGWSEFIGLRGPVPSKAIACGVLLLGPGTTYPAHAHAAEEVYLPIAGAAEWSRDGAAFAPVPVGQPIHHPGWMPHAMRTGTQALAALYLWRGGDLAAKSVFVSD